MHAAFKKPINWLICHDKKKVCVLRIAGGFYHIHMLPWPNGNWAAPPPLLLPPNQFNMTEPCMSFDIDVIKTANVLCPSPAFCCLAPWIALWLIGKISLEWGHACSIQKAHQFVDVSQ